MKSCEQEMKNAEIQNTTQQRKQKNKNYRSWKKKGKDHKPRYRMNVSLSEEEKQIPVFTFIVQVCMQILQNFIEENSSQLCQLWPDILKCTNLGHIRPNNYNACITPKE